MSRPRKVPKGEIKLIGGSPHRRVRCIRCGEVVWASAFVDDWHYVCNCQMDITKPVVRSKHQEVR